MDLKICYEGVEDTPQPSQTQLIQQSEDTLEVELQQDNNIEEVNNDVAVIEQEEMTLSKEQQQLQEVIAQSLSDHMKKLKLTVEKEIANSNIRLSEKLEALETHFVNQKTKKGK